jgi:hypothetical protein
MPSVLRSDATGALVSAIFRRGSNRQDCFCIDHGTLKLNRVFSSKRFDHNLWARHAPRAMFEEVRHEEDRHSSCDRLGHNRGIYLNGLCSII